MPWRQESLGALLGTGRVEEWRGGVGSAYLFPALSVAGASIASPCPVSTPRSSNRTGGFPASGSRTRAHAFAHEKLRFRPLSRTRPSRSWSDSLEYREYPRVGLWYLERNH